MRWRLAAGARLAALFRAKRNGCRSVPRKRYTPGVKLLRIHSPPPILLNHGVAWPDTTAKVEFDFVVAGLPTEIAPCKHVFERRTAEDGLEVWRVPRALVTYRSASIIVSVVCLECAFEAETDGAGERRGEENHD